MKSMVISILSVVLAGAALSFELDQVEVRWLEENPEVLLVGDPSWLPFESFTDQGAYEGIGPDHLKLIAEISGIKYRPIQTETWTESVEAIQRNPNIHMISETTDSSLSSVLTFTKPYYSTPIVFVTRKEIGFIESLDYVGDLEIILVQNYGYAGRIKRENPNLSFNEVATIEEALYGLSTGNGDVLLCTLPKCTFDIARLGINNLKIAGKTRYRTELAYGVQKEHAPLVSILNKAIDEITDQQQQAIMEQWNIQTLERIQSRALAVKVAVTASIIVAFLAAWLLTTLRLGKKIKKQSDALRKKNDQLEAVIASERETRKQLMEADRMASLGRMVAGVAHEVNTPLGAIVTLGSSIHDSCLRTKRLLEDKKLTQSDLQAFLDDVDESAKVLQSSSRRAATLIGSFKQIAVDQTGEAKREFMLGEYFEEIITSFNHKFKNTNIKLDRDFPSQDVKLQSYPGAIAQILSNLFMNSYIHGYHDGVDPGTIKLRFRLTGSVIAIEYSDDGCGMTEEQIDHVFEPFFTTRRNAGGTGLGMSVTYNVVTQLLGGSISCESKEGEGVRFKIVFPSA